MHRLLPLMAQASAPAFAPTDISGLVAWYDFSDITTLFTDSARTTAVTADADPIGGVTDKSGSANHLGQGTASKRPTYKVAIQNSKSIARFDGSDDILSRTASIPSISTGATLCMVIKYASDEYSFALGGYYNGAAYRLLSSSSKHYGNLQTTAGAPANIGGAVASTSFGIVTLRYAAATGVRLLRVNTTDTTNTITAANILQNQTLLYLGGAEHDTHVFSNLNGDIAECILYDSALSDANRDSVLTYLNTKWAVY